MTFLQTLIARREAIATEVEGILTTASGEERTTFTEDETTRLTELLGEARTVDERIVELRDFETGTEAAASAAAAVEGGGSRGGARVRHEPMTYERHQSRSSFFLDMGRAQINGDTDAADRLARHRQEIAVERQQGGRLYELAETERRAFARWVSEVEDETRRSVTVERRDIDRVDNTGGEFVPPLWLLELYADQPRGGRATADLCRQIPLPGATDQINVPKITTGGNTAAQAADNAAVAEQDWVTASAQAPVRTIAGQVDSSLQLLEQSPVAFDEIVFIDLVEDYHETLDTQVLAGAGTSGTIKGVLNATGVTTVTYTDASPTVAELYPKIGDAIQQSGTNRKRVPTHIIKHLRRWAWINSALDSTGRPLSVPLSPFSGGPTNAAAVQSALETSGLAGSMHGLPVYVDLNMPTTLGGGTEDAIVVGRPFDWLLFEGQLRARVLREVLSGTLGVRFQVYAYCAFTAERFPAGIVKIAGTGLAAPTF